MAGIVAHCAGENGAVLGGYAHLLRARYLWAVALLPVVLSPERGAQAQERREDPAVRAAAARDSGNPALAEQIYRDAIGADPKWVQGWWLLGSLQYQQKQFAASRDSLSRYLASTPRAGAARALRGLAEFETGEFEAALGDMEQGIAEGAAIQKRNAQILLFHEGLALTRLGHFEEAITKFALLARQGEPNEEVVVALGLTGLRIATPRDQVAAADLRLAEQSGRAALQILRGEDGAGREAFGRLYAAEPTRASLHYFCGYVLLTADPDQAIEEMRKELVVDPASKPALTMLAWALELRGAFGEALPVAQAAVRANPASTTNQLLVGRALLETNDTAGAVSELNQVVAAEPQNLEVHLELAKAYSLLGRREEARKERLLCLQLSDTRRTRAP